MEFKPENDLMPQLVSLTSEKIAKKWYKQYLEYHKGIDQGIYYLIGYFPDNHRNNLKKWLNL